LRPPRGLALVGLLLAFSSLCAAAEQRISSVSVNGVTGAELTDAQRVIKVRAGDVYSEKALQDDVISLLGLPFILSARAKENITPAGVEVTYDIAVKGRLTGVAFAGNHKFKAKKLRQIGGLEKTEYYDLALLTEARNLIIDKYKTSGYLFAKVDFASQPDGSVLFTIDEGPRLKVVRVTIIGNTVFSDAVIKKNAVKTKTRKWLILPYRLDETVIQEDSARIQDFYRDAGYLDVNVKVNFNLTSNGKGIIVDYTVTEGPLYTTRNVTIAGNSVVSAARLESVLKMTAGKPFSPSRTNKDIAAMKSVYGQTGYIDAAVSPRPTFQQQGTEVDVAYTVTEGGPVAVKEVEILGNDKTRDNVIRRELEFRPGETYNTDKIEESKSNLNKLGYFSKVDISPDNKTPGAPNRDALVNVEETNTGSFLVGVGISSNQGLIGTVALMQRNFDYRTPPKNWHDVSEGRAWSGGGQQFELRAAPGTELSQAGVTWRDPHVNDSDYSLGLGAHLWNRIWNSYTERRIGGEVSVGRHFTKHTTGEITTTIDDVHIGSIEKGAPKDVTSVKGSHMDDVLGFSLAHDTTDSFVLPTKGHLVNGVYETSDKFLGSDFEWQRWRTDGAWYKLLKKDELDRPYILSLRGRLGYMTTFSDDQIPIYDRLYAGGFGDVRGFAYRGLGPHSKDETPLGGELVTTGGIQYDYPIAADVLRGDFFTDAGNLAGKPGDFNFGDFRYSAGFGFKIIIPPPLNFPVVIDFGFPIHKEHGDESQLVSFSIGKFF